MTRNRTSDPHIHKTNNKTQQQQRWPGWLKGRALNKNIKSKSWLASFIGTSDLPKTTRQHQVWILNGFVYRNLRYTPTNNNIESKSWLASFIGTSDLLTTSKCEFWLASFIGTSNSLATQPKIFNIATHHKMMPKHHATEHQTWPHISVKSHNDVSNEEEAKISRNTSR